MKDTVFYSKNCEHSVRLIQALKSSGLANSFCYVSVDNDESNKRNDDLLFILEVDRVPTVYAKGQKYAGTQAFTWLQSLQNPQQVQQFHQQAGHQSHQGPHALPPRQMPSYQQPGHQQQQALPPPISTKATVPGAGASGGQSTMLTGAGSGPMAGAGFQGNDGGGSGFSAFGGASSDAGGFSPFGGAASQQQPMMSGTNPAQSGGCLPFEQVSTKSKDQKVDALENEFQEMMKRRQQEIPQPVPRQ